VRNTGQCVCVRACVRACVGLDVAQEVDLNAPVYSGSTGRNQRALKLISAIIELSLRPTE
jgi:hypothetical protein